MDHSARLLNLQHVSRELDTRYLGLAHREQQLAQSLTELHSLRAAVSQTRTLLAQQQAALAQVTQRLPVLARTEALDRVQQRLDATPFEQFAQRSSIRRGAP